MLYENQVQCDLNLPKILSGEVGMLVGKIVKDSLTQKFDGYADESESMKKIAFDVFEKGDCVFLTGFINVNKT